MPTLITVYNSRGCVGRCDAKCHNAIMPECVCICGGVNHGVGLDQARLNTKKIADEQLRKNCEPSAGDGDLKIIRESRQLKLF